jgi:hypothetical protein
VDRVLGDSKQLTCKELNEYVQGHPDILACFSRNKTRYRTATSKVVDAKKRLEDQLINLKVLK